MEAKPRAPRTDARRSRERILAAAREMLAADGPDVALDRVAREAGVGNATLYRHFPTRAALLSALFHDQTESLCVYASELAQQSDALESLRIWLTTLARETTRSAGLAVALRGMGDEFTSTNSCHELIHESTGVLIGNALQAGRVRAGVTAADALTVVTGIALASGHDASSQDSERLVGYFVDGIAASSEITTRRANHTALA
jgi:AcrR family transcriptional regulator